MIFSYTDQIMFSLDLFFSIKRFLHKALWEEGESVWYPLLVLERYLKTQKLGQIEVDIPAGVFIQNPELVSIGEKTILEPGVLIQGPCILGKECVVRHGAFLRGGVICGERCSIGHSAEIKHSILLDEAQATHFSYIGDSIIGNRANLGAGVKCANLRLDRREVVVRAVDEIFETGLKKMGAIVGDGVQVGCNCVLNPGSLIGRETICYPLLNFSGYAPPRSQIKAPVGWTIKPSDGADLLEQIRR